MAVVRAQTVEGQDNRPDRALQVQFLAQLGACAATAAPGCAIDIILSGHHPDPHPLDVPR